MIEVTATDMARAFSSFLGKVEHGETVVVRKHGKPVARLIPDSAFMSGHKAADLFRSHKAGKPPLSRTKSASWTASQKMRWLIDSDILIEGERENPAFLPWLESQKEVATADIIRAEFLLGV